MTSIPVVGITMGDPAGIGPEIVCKTLSNEKVYAACRPFVIGSRAPMEHALRTCGLSAALNIISHAQEGSYQYGKIDIVDLPLTQGYEPGVLSAEHGRAAIAYMQYAHEMIKNGEMSLTVSAPANKEAMKQAGSPYAGATELFAHLAGVAKAETVIQQDGCYFFQVTTHVSLRNALDQLNYEKIYTSIHTAFHILRQWGLEKPVIAVSAINPHMGEGGLLGNEEIEFIIPAIQKATEEGICVRGPIPADAIFSKAYAGEYDAALLMFHDTANIPIKLLSSQKPAVVFSAGLPFVRATVAHGTAYDIAYQNKASHVQLEAALLAAANIGARLAQQNTK